MEEELELEMEEVEWVEFGEFLFAVLRDKIMDVLFLPPLEKKIADVLFLHPSKTKSWMCSFCIPSKTKSWM